MKAFYLNLRIFGKISLVLACMVGIFSCSETPEPDQPQMQNPPPKEDPDDDPDEVLTVYEQMEGKWMIAELPAANLRKTNPTSAPLPLWGKIKPSKNQRIKDDHQGFIEFLDDSTYILNDPKILGPEWNIYYGKVTVPSGSSKIELENYGEITNFDFDQGKFIFEIKEKDKDNAVSLEATKRDGFEMDERTRFLCKIWSLTDESEAGSLLLEDMKAGVEVYKEGGEITEVYYPDGFTMMFTPSGSILTAHIVDGHLRPFDMINWRWNQAGLNQLVLTYDYSSFDEDNFTLDLKELADSRLVLPETYENDKGEDIEDEIVLIPY